MSINFKERLFICGRAEREEYRSRGLSHVVGIANPGAPPFSTSWFDGSLLQLWFGDVTSKTDAALWKTSAPKIKDVQQALEFVRIAWSVKESKVLVSCDYGASRSTALAYLFIADQLGVGRETEALTLMRQIRPHTIPNGMLVRLGDTFLKRRGKLIRPFKDLFFDIDTELPQSSAAKRRASQKGVKR
jgi:predicted protein tyrosine phosphatase